MSPGTFCLFAYASCTSHTIYACWMSICNAKEIVVMIKAGLVWLESWLIQRTEDDHADLVDLAQKCVQVLCKVEF